MQHIYLIMLVAATVSSSPLVLRSSPDNADSSTHSSIEPLTSSPDSTGSLDQCHFTAPHARPISLSAPSPFTDPENRPQAPLKVTPSPPTNPSSGIPAAAWPHISSLLTNFIAEKQNNIRTLDLGRALNDATLEGVMMGLVYSSTAPRTPATRSLIKDARVKVKAREKTGSEIVNGEVKVETAMNEKAMDNDMMACVESAVHKVERTKQMEGALQISPDREGNGGGRVSFLVYRRD